MRASSTSDSRAPDYGTVERRYNIAVNLESWELLAMHSIAGGEVTPPMTSFFSAPFPNPMLTAAGWIVEHTKSPSPHAKEPGGPFDTHIVAGGSSSVSSGRGTAEAVVEGAVIHRLETK